MKTSNHSNPLKNAVTAAFLLSCFNRWIDASSIQKKASTRSRHFYHWQHGDICYDVQGDGEETLLLLHDLTPYSSSHEWEDALLSLKEDFTVYTVDLPGCGRSDKKAGLYSINYYVDFLSSFIQDIIQTPVHVVGCGLSAAFILMTNFCDPSLFENIILLSPPSIKSLAQGPALKSKLIRFIFDLPIIGNTVYYTLTNHINTDQFYREKAVYNPFILSPHICKASYDASHIGNAFGKFLYSSILGHYLYADVSDAIAETNTPIHMVFGTENLNHVRIIKEYRHLNPEISCEVAEECKMYPHLEVIDDFLDCIYDRCLPLEEDIISPIE